MLDTVKPAEIVLWVVGAIAALWGLWKAKVDGFYAEETFVVIGAIIGGGLLIALAQYLRRQRLRKEAAEADRSHGVEQ